MLLPMWNSERHQIYCYQKTLSLKIFTRGDKIEVNGYPYSFNHPHIRSILPLPFCSNIYDLEIEHEL